MKGWQCAQVRVSVWWSEQWFALTCRGNKWRAVGRPVTFQSCWLAELCGLLPMAASVDRVLRIAFCGRESAVGVHDCQRAMGFLRMVFWLKGMIEKSDLQGRRILSWEKRSKEEKKVGRDFMQREIWEKMIGEKRWWVILFESSLKGCESLKVDYVMRLITVLSKVPAMWQQFQAFEYSCFASSTPSGRCVVGSVYPFRANK